MPMTPCASSILLVAAMLLNAGGFFAAGAYEVVWAST